MIEVGITGNIGSGKSSVTSYLQNKGYTVIDADEIVKLIYQNDEFKNEMLITFGEQIKSDYYEVDKELDKRKIFNIVFQDEEKLAQLDKLVGPYFKKILDKELEKHKDEEILFLDIPLLFEKDYQKYMDKIILVYCEDAIRYARASERDNKTIAEIQSVDNAQMPQSEKVLLADYMIDNSHSLAHLYNQIEEILKKIDELKNNE